MRLLPDENVEWVTQKGFFSISLVLSFVVAFIGIFPVLFGFFGGESNGVPFPPNPPVGWVGVVWVLTALGCAIYLIVETKGTKYVMTNKRIMVTKLEKVVKEISLSSFMGKPVSQFVDKTAAAMVNNEQVYNVRITSPASLDSIEFRFLSESTVQRLEGILEEARKSIRCGYCSSINPAESSTCAHCGAPLQ